MKIKAYLVGGAVRDTLLALPVKERDWVVVGAAPADMKRLGYRQVGKDFPVFLHPETNEEYALARKERKTGPGYTGFDFDASKTVTLEEDLLRRDLTINAMAQAPDGTLIDPFQGRKDLEARILRHVSMAFVEDPVRILRVARFAARFAALGFHVAKETLTLMQTMVRSGEVNALVPERVWKELERALGERHPEAFFEVLDACGALQVLFPENILQGQTALRAAVRLTEDPVIRFAAMLHRLDRETLDTLCGRFRAPNDYSELAQMVVRCFPQYRIILGASAEEIVQLLQEVDAFRRRARFEKWLIACEACLAASDDNPKEQRLFFSSRETKDQEAGQSAFLRDCFRATAEIDAAALSVGARGSEIAERIRQARIQAVTNFLRGSEEHGTDIMMG